MHKSRSFSSSDIIQLTTMRPLLFLSNAFINTFGITQPTPKSASRAAWFIAVMLGLVVVLVATVAAVVLHLAFHH
jgi:hypothetical protein